MTVILILVFKIQLTSYFIKKIGHNIFFYTYYCICYLSKRYHNTYFNCVNKNILTPFKIKNIKCTVVPLQIKTKI